MSATRVLIDIITKNPRELWCEKLNPFIYKENVNEIFINDYDFNPNKIESFNITRKELSKDYISKFNIGDIVLYNNEEWVVYSYPMLDSRNPLDFIRERVINVLYEGAFYEIIKPNKDGEPLLEVQTELIEGVESLVTPGYRNDIFESQLQFSKRCNKNSNILSNKIKNNQIKINL